MIHLVYGGSGSGKSEYAEKLVMDLNTQNKYYLATMKVYDDEGKAKVQRHRELRKGKGFITIESESLNLTENATKEIDNTSSTILIECISNLVANEMFQINKIMNCNEVAEKIYSDFNKLKGKAENIIIVSNNVFEDGIDYNEATENYMQALGRVNVFLARESDKVTEVVCGIPVELK